MLHEMIDGSRRREARRVTLMRMRPLDNWTDEALGELLIEVVDDCPRELGPLLEVAGNRLRGYSRAHRMISREYGRCPDRAAMTAARTDMRRRVRRLWAVALCVIGGAMWLAWLATVDAERVPDKLTAAQVQMLRGGGR